MTYFLQSKNVAITTLLIRHYSKAHRCLSLCRPQTELIILPIWAKSGKMVRTATLCSWHRRRAGRWLHLKNKSLSECWNQSHGAFVLQYDQPYLLTAPFANWNPDSATFNYISVLRVLSLFFLFCYGSPAERESSQENISAHLVKRWENSHHKKKTKLIVVWNHGLSMPDGGKPLRWKSHAKEMSRRGF